MTITTASTASTSASNAATGEADHQSDRVRSSLSGSMHPAVYDTSHQSGVESGPATRAFASTSEVPAPPDPYSHTTSARTGVTRPDRTSTATGPARTTAPAPADVSMQKTADRYDGGHGVRRNYVVDQQNGARLRSSTDAALIGYPREFRKNTGDVIALAPQLAQMDPSDQRRFAARAMVALRLPPDQQHAEIATLQRDVAKQFKKVMQDPAQRVTAIFNAPVGSEILSGGGKDGIKRLSELFDRATDPNASNAQRDTAISDAANLKADMQRVIASRLDDHLADEQERHKQSLQRINSFIDKCETLNGHRFELLRNSEDSQWNDTARALSAKSYPLEALAEELISPDGRSQQEVDSTPPSQAMPTSRTPDEIQRDLLNFQDGMNTPGSEIYNRVHAIEQRATDTLTHNDLPGFSNVAAPATFSAIAGKLPAPDVDYINNLAAKYGEIAESTKAKDLDMIRQTPTAYEKGIYALGKVLASMMPPGLDLFAKAMLDVAVPGNAGYTSDQLGDIDLAAMIVGLLPAGSEKVPGLKLHIPETHLR